jgi:hypothetical protein
MAQAVMHHWDCTNNPTLAPHPHRDVVKQRLGQCVLHWLYILLTQVGADQPVCGAITRRNKPVLQAML